MRFGIGRAVEKFNTLCWYIVKMNTGVWLILLMTTSDEFRNQLLNLSSGEVVDQFILTDDPGPHTSREALSYLETKIRDKFSLPVEDSLETIVVGSAKLGFAILDKLPRNGKRYQPAYRVFCPGQSDIDIAVVSQRLYGKIWQDLARFGAHLDSFPWRSELSAYMLHGWIRPDKFPQAAPQKCIDWKELINEVSRSSHFRYKNLRCGIYHSKYFLRIYQQRGVITAQQAERVA